MMDYRENAGYVITDSCHVGDSEFPAAGSCSVFQTATTSVFSVPMAVMLTEAAGILTSAIWRLAVDGITSVMSINSLR